jgi:hypothetical protein
MNQRQEKEMQERNLPMNRSLLLLLLGAILLLSVPSPGAAQLWNGVISPKRGVDWSIAGIPGGLPDGNWTQCGATIAPYSGSATTINNALASCGANHYVSLGAGTFVLSSSIVFPNSGHVVLRGAGANATFIQFNGSASACNGTGAIICVMSSDGTYPGGSTTAVNWTGGYAQGANQITLSSVSGITPNKTLLFLNQCDTGFSGSSCTGSAVDNGGYFVCAQQFNGSTGCSTSGPDGATWRANAYQQEVVTVTAINPGNCGATCVSISQPLKHPNWAASQSPQAVLIQPVVQNGIENLAIDALASGSKGQTAIGFQNAYQCWVSGVKMSNIYEFGVYALGASHLLIQHNYLFHSNGHPDAYAIRISWGGDDLVQNNIVQQWKNTTANDGPSSGDVFAYNFSVNQIVPSPSDFMWGAYWAHSAGDDFELWEGNVGTQQQNDNVHGSHLNQTKFRNFLLGWESCANGNCGSAVKGTSGSATSAMIDSSNVRYAHNIGNVLGTPGFTTTYQTTTPFSGASSFTIGAGGTNSPTTPADPLVASTMLRWGNYDVATGTVRWCGNSSNTGWASTCSGVSEVPTAAPSYPNSVPTVGDTGAGQSPLPPSFYLSSKPAWFGSTPWPAIGPDVASGNIGQCSGLLNVSGGFDGLPVLTTLQCGGTSTKTAAWGGHVNANPAMSCYLTVMGGRPDGTGTVLPFNPFTCYGLGNPPPQGPPAPASLATIVNTN